MKCCFKDPVHTVYIKLMWVIFGEMDSLLDFRNHWISQEVNLVARKHRLWRQFKEKKIAINIRGKKVYQKGCKKLSNGIFLQMRNLLTRTFKGFPQSTKLKNLYTEPLDETLFTYSLTFGLYYEFKTDLTTSGQVALKVEQALLTW